MLTSRLTEFFCHQNNINVNADYEIERINANELITKERIDLIAKLKYIEYKEKGYDLTFIKELYTAHIEAFSHGSFAEPGNELKNSIDRYFETFDYLIDHIKKNGFDETISVIPVGSNNAIMDGAHRVSIAAYFNLEVSIIRFKDISVTFDTAFFEENLLDKKYLDFLVAEYCKLKENIYVACIWPKAHRKRKQVEIEQLINESCGVIYKKAIQMKYRGLRNLIPQIYSTEDWIGNIDNNFSGAKAKADACYSLNGTVTVYVLECDIYERIPELKDRIRELVAVGKHSIHITDTSNEVHQIANLLLNQNSIYFLNAAKPFVLQQLNQKIMDFKKKSIEDDYNREDIIIGAHSVSAYKLRQIQEVSILTDENSYDKNPNNYFVYNEYKFLNLKFLNYNPINSFHSLVNVNKRKVRNLKYKLKKFLKKYGLYESVRFLYRSLKSTERSQ